MTFQFLLELMPLKETILSSIKNQILTKKNFYSDFLSYIQIEICYLQFLRKLDWKRSSAHAVIDFLAEFYTLTWF